jgi:hypothetical protein
VGGLTKVAGIGDGGGQNQIPFAIEGTTSVPKFVPDVPGVAAGVVTSRLSNAVKGQVPGHSTATKGLGAPGPPKAVK